MKKFYISPTEHAANVINFGKKKMLPLTEKELTSRFNGVLYLQKLAQKLAKEDMEVQPIVYVQ